VAAKKDLDYYLSQARRIAEHREAGAEREIRKLYKSMLKDLQQLMSDTYIQYSKDDRLSYAILQEAGYHARFLEEVEQRLNLATPAMRQELHDLVEETYAAAYEAMIKGVMAQGIDGFDPELAQSLSITPDQIKAAVENPVSGLTLTDTLEKNRKDIVYSIKQTIGIGLMNGDRYSTMANRIVDRVDGDYRKAIRIARTEAHRVREMGNMDAALRVDEELQKGSTGLRMVKTWRTMKDEKVRPQRAAYKRKPGVKPRKKNTAGWRSMLNGPNHVKMEGQVRLVTEKFDLGSYKGAKVEAMAPTLSGVAAHDIQCRCYASEELMSDEQYFKLTGKHFPGYEEAKKAAGTVENSGNGDIIKPYKVITGHEETPKEFEAGGVIDRKDSAGIVKVRSFYGADKLKAKDIHTTPHNNPKLHAYGNNGEHVHTYEWNADGTLKNKTTRELNAEERKNNGDIL